MQIQNTGEIKCSSKRNNRNELKNGEGNRRKAAVMLSFREGKIIVHIENIVLVSQNCRDRTDFFWRKRKSMQQI